MYFFEKVNPAHPDKVADRTAGFLTDLLLRLSPWATIAGEALIGHGFADFIAESSFPLRQGKPSALFTSSEYDIKEQVKGFKGLDEEIKRLEEKGEGMTLLEADDYFLFSLKKYVLENLENSCFSLLWEEQDKHLKENAFSKNKRVGDNGIFKGVRPNMAEQLLTDIMAFLYKEYPSDGKGVISTDDNENFNLTLCLSNCELEEEDMRDLLLCQREKYTPFDFSIKELKLNPLGFWTGGLRVDTGAVNRKLGSDMGRAATGGGLHFKDLSKADITLNICCHLLAELFGEEIRASVAIGDDEVVFYTRTERLQTLPFSNCIKIAQSYIDKVGGFEKFAEWGLIRPSFEK